MDCDVVVVGAGLTGSSAARTLASRGYEVIVAEAFELNHDLGSSHGTSRIYRRAYADPFYVGLTGQAEAAWRELVAESGVQLRTQIGAIDAGSRRQPERLVQLLSDSGVEAELLSADEGAERWPGMTFDGPIMFHPEAGYLDANATVRALMDLAQEHGAIFRPNTRIESIESTGDGVIVRTGQESWSARKVVIAAGAWLPELWDSVALTAQLPAMHVRQQEVFHYRHRDPSAQWPSLVYKGDVELYGLVSGADGGPEPAMKVAQFDSTTITTASTRDGTIDPRAEKVVTDFVARWLPGLDPTPVASQSCLFTMTADEDFVIDRTGHIVVASPCSGHGAKFAPILGDLIADLVAGSAPLSRFAFRR